MSYTKKTPMEVRMYGFFDKHGRGWSQGDKMPRLFDTIKDAEHQRMVWGSGLNNFEIKPVLVSVKILRH